MNHRRLICWVFIDALGWELFQRRGLLASHWQTIAPMQSVLGYSCACDPTILTGLMPQQHRHFSFFVPASAKSPLSSVSFLRWLPERLENHGRVRSKISRLLAKHHGFTGYFQLYHVPAKFLPLFDYSEQRDLYEPGGINGGQDTFFDVLRSRSIEFWKADWRRPDSENFQQALQVVEQGEVSFAYLYLAALDGKLHREGLKGSSLESLLSWYETQLAQLLETAQHKYDDVRLRLISDHGMADVSHTHDLWSILQKLPLKFGVDYLAMLDSTMLRVWLRGSEEQKAHTRELLHSAIPSSESGSWLSDTELSQLGCLFEDRLYGDEFYLLSSGGLIVPSFMNRKFVAGMHGYHPSETASTALFAASESIESPPARLDQVFDQVISDLDWLEGVDSPMSASIPERYAEVVAS